MHLLALAGDYYNRIAPTDALNLALHIATVNSSPAESLNICPVVFTRSQSWGFELSSMIPVTVAYFATSNVGFATGSGRRSRTAGGGVYSANRLRPPISF